MRMAIRSSREAAGLLIGAALALLGLAALAAPEALLAWGPPCLFTLALGHPCPGCGMTRALLALLHGDLAAAWGHNRLSPLVLPLLLALYARHLRRLWRRPAE